MLSDTGARQAEVVGLRKEDVILTGDVPHILIRPNGNRGLKNAQSERKVPLVGEALWAAQRAMTTVGEHLFPVFQPRKAGATFNPNSASAALNKWLKENELAKTGQGLHSFRHTLVDRLRDARVPKDVREQIGGWKSQGVSEGYGQGFSLRRLHEAMLHVAVA
jgi:integrase